MVSDRFWRYISGEMYENKKFHEENGRSAHIHKGRILSVKINRKREDSHDPQKVDGIRGRAERAGMSGGAFMSVGRLLPVCDRLREESEFQREKRTGGVCDLQRYQSSGTIANSSEREKEKARHLHVQELYVHLSGRVLREKGFQWVQRKDRGVLAQRGNPLSANAAHGTGRRGRQYRDGDISIYCGTLPADGCVLCH